MRSVGAVAIGGVETGDRSLGGLSHLAKGSPRRVADHCRLGRSRLRSWFEPARTTDTFLDVSREL